MSIKGLKLERCPLNFLGYFREYSKVTALYCKCLVDKSNIVLNSFTLAGSLFSENNAHTKHF